MQRYTSIFSEGYQHANVFHAVDSKYVIDQLKSDKIKATSTQRYWLDGKKRLDNDPEYRKSFWMVGVSTTRDINFAKSWHDVIYELDLEKIKQNYKVDQIDWGSSIPNRSSKNRGREKEEFIICGRLPKVYESENITVHTKLYRKWIKDIEKIPPLAPLSKYLVSIYLSEKFLKYFPEEVKEVIVAHPLYAGIV